jgi:homocitrate synthase NifV
MQNLGRALLIRITDRTLSCVDDRSSDKSALVRFLHFLLKIDPGAIELSEKVYHLLSPLPEYPSYILRIENPADVKKYQADNYPPDTYPHITEFICRNVPASAPFDAREKIRAEISLENTLANSSETIARYAGYTKVRILGLDYLMSDDYMRAFEYLKKEFNGSVERLEFCPRNHFNCATALAAEWITSGAGTHIVTSFGGIGGFAPTEELLMILREYRLRGEDKIYKFFPEMTRLFHRLTKKNVSPNKPIIGSHIFHVESGVHVDGILKQPKSYEPFAPEIVGQKRKIVLGKHSGTASIIAKLSEFDIKCAKERIPFVLEQIKNKAMEENGEVTDSEFVRLLREQLHRGGS